MSYKIFLLLFLFLFISGNSVFASPKKILALYKSNENTSASDNPILNHFGEQLKELGYEVDYKDALGQLPAPDEMKQYDGIITFYFGPIHPKAKEYIHWLGEQIKSGRKVIILGNFGAHSVDGNSWLTNEDLNDFFFLLGLSFSGGQKVKPEDIEIVYKDPGIISSLPSRLPEDFVKFESINPDNKDYLKLSLKNLPDIKSSLVVRTPFGAMAQIGYIYSTEPTTGKIIWHLNRLEFLKDALGYEASQKLSSKVFLGLYKSSENQTAQDNLLKKFASEPLFKLGYQIDYMDIDKGIPDEGTMARYSGVISWYKGPSMYQAKDYCQWLSDQIASQKKVIILGNFGAYMDKIKKNSGEITRFLESLEINNFFYPFGLKMDRQWTSDPNLINCDYLDKDVINGQLLSKPEDFKNYFTFRSILPADKPFLTLSRRDIPDSKSDIVVTTPYGGMALEGYIYRQKPDTWETDFIVNLDKFLAACLKESAFVAPKTYIITVDPGEELNRGLKERKAMVLPLPCPAPLVHRVLVLYKQSECITGNFEFSPFWLYADVVLNHLGVACDYADIEKGKPDDKTMEDYMAVITWFETSAMEGADEYNDWLFKQIDKGKKVIILNNYGALYEEKNYKYSPGVKKVFEKLGLNFDDQYFQAVRNIKEVKNEILTTRENELAITAYDFPRTSESGRPDVYSAFYYDGKIIHKEDIFDFEEPMNLQSQLGTIPVSSVDEKNKILLKVYNSVTGEITPAVTGPWGGILLGSFFYDVKDIILTQKSYSDLLTLRYDVNQTETDNGRWIVNPFVFFRDSLGLNELPKLDYTTLNGQRIFYSHIDGDGLVNVTKIDPTKYAGEIVTEDVLKKYNLPISASVITHEIADNGLKYYNPAMEMARNMFALDNIEIANHTHTHPFDMVGGDMKLELGSEMQKKTYKVGYKIPSPDEEVLYSNALINQNLAPQGKESKIVFWPGRCNPTEEFLTEADKLGLENINGGDPIYDEHYNSYSNLCPVLSRKGSKLQIHTSSSNDFIYTRAWTGDYGGMTKLIEHIEKTDRPVRISPVNIYYHLYSGMYREGLDALHTLYDYCLKEHVAPVFASQYSLIIKDFYYSQLGKTSDGGYIIRNMGYLRTIRFDDTNLFLDLERSEHVLGFDYYNNSLYISLDDSGEHKIYLTDKAQTRTYLKSASHYIDNWQAEPKGVKAIIQGIGPGYMEIANLKPDTSYRVKLGGEEQIVQTGKEGLLEFKYELKGKPRAYELEVVMK